MAIIDDMRLSRPPVASSAPQTCDELSKIAHRVALRIDGGIAGPLHPIDRLLYDRHSVADEITSREVKISRSQNEIEVSRRAVASMVSDIDIVDKAIETLRTVFPDWSPEEI